MIDGDRLLLIEEISELTRKPPETLRWLRHTNQIDWLWRSGRRLVAWESQVRKWLEEQQAATTRR